MTAANKAELRHFHSADIFVWLLNFFLRYIAKCVSYKRCWSLLEREHKWFTGSPTPKGLRRSVGAAGEMLNMQCRSRQLAAGRRQLAQLTALVGTDIFNRIVTSHMPPFFQPPTPESRQPSSPEPEIRLGLIHTALYLLSTSHYAPRCREQGFSLLHVSLGK